MTKEQSTEQESTQDSKLHKLNKQAKRFMELPTSMIAICIFLGALVVVSAALGAHELGLEPDLGHVVFGVFFIIGLVPLYIAFHLVRYRFLPLDQNGVELLEAFPFNKGGEEHLKQAARKRTLLRNEDLYRALRLHYNQENSELREALQRRAQDGLKRFTTEQVD